MALFVSSAVMAQGLPTLEPIPSPAADDGQGVLPSNEPTPADPATINLEPTPAEVDIDTFDSSQPTEAPLEISPPADGAVKQVDYQEVTEGPALEPIIDSSTSNTIVLDAPVTTAPVEFRPQPIQLQSVPSSAPVILEPTPIHSYPSVTTTSPPCACDKNKVTQSTVVRSEVVQSQVIQRQVVSPPIVNYVSPPAPAPLRIAPNSIAPPSIVVRSAPNARPVTYYRVDPTPATQATTQVVVRQAAPNPAPRYYPNPVQPAQATVRVRVQPGPPQMRVPSNQGYTQVQVTETTRFVPVQVQARPTTTVVVPASAYVPLQPFRNAARRRAGY